MKYEKEFPLFKTKVEGVDKDFDLSDPARRAEYFQAKAGGEIARLKNFFDQGKTFIAYMLGKKNSGKGTYTKLLSEIFGKDKIAHVSVGDVVRSVHEALKTEKGKQELVEYLKKDYRGFISIEEGIDAILNRSQDKVSVPNELMLSLIKREIDKHPGKSIFLDGFPRTLDQVSYSLYFKALVDYREDPDIFVDIDIPESVIDARMKHRVVCPVCHAPRNLMLFTTKEAGYDKEKKEFYLKCDNTECEKPGTRMGVKEGDNMGIESIRARLEMDDQLADKVFSIHGVPRILLRNAVPVDRADGLVDKYEITPEYYYEYDEKNDRVNTLERSWVAKDDEGVEVYSLLAPPVVFMLIKQLAKSLNL